MSLRQRLSEQLTGWAYQLGWNLIRRVPESWARRAFAAVAEVAWRRQGPKVQVLESNLRHVLSWKQGRPDVDGQELRAVSRDGPALLRAVLARGLPAARDPAGAHRVRHAHRAGGTGGRCSPPSGPAAA